MVANRIVRFFLFPITLVQGLSGEDASSEIDRRLSVDSTTPKERLLGVEWVMTLAGLLIPVTMVICILLAWIFNNPSVALNVVIAPLIFLFSSFIWLARRTIPASRDLKRWNRMVSQGEVSLYSPGKDAIRSIPQDRDFIVPLVVTIVIAPIVLISGVLIC